MRHISERDLELPDAIIGRLIQIAAEDKNILSLGPGEPDFDVPKPIVNYTRKIAGKVNHYSPPGGRSELKESIAKKLRKDNRIKCSPENIMVTSGSQEALLLSIAATLDVSEQIIIPNPSFLAYLPAVEMFNAFPVFTELKEEEKFEINPDSVEKLIDKKKTKAILINSPANPTGAVIRKKTLEELSDIAVDNDLYIFSDEAYEKIIYGAKHVSPASLNGMNEYVLTFQTFSKTYAMCGYRLGYVCGPENLIKIMTKTHVYSTICAPTISQMLGVKALSLPKKYTNTMVHEYKRRRNLLVKRLNEIGLYTIKPEGAFYTFSRIPGKSSMGFSKKLLKKAKVAVVPGSEFGSHGEGYIRCSYATDYKIIEKALERIEKFIKSV
jgi:aminotransferase